MTPCRWASTAGDIAKRFLKRADKVRDRRGGEPATAIVSDINYEMLAAGLTTKEGGKENTLNNRIERVCGNAEQLPFDDNSADVMTISFGIRNVTDRDAALREFYRILKPGGRLFVLEFSTPPDKFLRQIYDSYSFAVIPKLGKTPSPVRLKTQASRASDGKIIQAGLRHCTMVGKFK